VLPPWCFHHAARSQTGSLRLSPLRHMRIRKSTMISEACRASYVPPSGFGYPPGGFLLPNPLDRFSDPSARGVFPFRVFLPPKEPCLFRDLLLSCRLLELDRKTQRSPRLQSFAPPGRAALATRAIKACRYRCALGGLISGVLSPASLLPLRVNSSFALHARFRQASRARCALEFF
jgi:hypothetical protein